MTPNRSTPRRAAARRFSLPRDLRWERLQRAVLSAGVTAAVVAVLRQAGLFAEASDLGMLLGPVGVALAAASLPVRARPVDVLRWDGAQWWWQQAGEPLAVTPDVFIDIERWMLLRLNPAVEVAGVPRRGRQPVRWIAASRGALGGQWTPLRLHLFLARG
ncbi:hypothetical protein [Roseateles chitinivorans]|uniref:hypothetical protein n=1 Tax=Roseateles chitinivorans TaxID=2917965 RepID=UPI0011806A45|nr:hypothetical protein [Roseateles chitinivorans]